MKVNYKIVWLDDQPGMMKNIIRDIEAVLEENYFIPAIQEPYKSYEDFQMSFQTANDTNIYGEVFNDCDLLLIDYNIAEKKENEEKTGATLIKELRKRGIYTETIFYSSAMDDYRKKLDRPELDNVVYADKSELVDKVEKLVKKTVVQSMIISNLRGYLMDCTSDFDFVWRVVSEYYFERLNEEQQFEILKQAETYIHTQFKNENKKFKEINKKYGNIDFYVSLEENTFASIKENSARTKKIQKAFDSQESVMLVRDKFRLLAFILNKSNIKSAEDIYIFNDTEKDANKHHTDKYKDAIIDNRNKLAHNKLDYGKKCKNRIKIIQTLDDMICNCTNNTCEKSYTYEQCKELRKNIYNYYILFNSLLNSIET
jgi:hypothetical protein